MDKRQFMKVSSAMLTASLLSPLLRCAPSGGRRNWAGNLEYGASDIATPSTNDEVRETISSVMKARILGTRHSFSAIADSPDNLISSENFNQIGNLDRDALTVEVGGGTRYGELAVFLHNNGFALHNLASLPHISVAGAIATGTHGSGMSNGNLSTAVRRLELITATGEIKEFSDEQSDDFLGSVVGLGSLGMVTRVTLAVQPTYQVRQKVYLNLPMKELRDNFIEIMSAGYSVSLFTDWQNDINQVWIKQRVDRKETETGKEWFGAKAATKNVHPIIELSAENCTEQMGYSGAWFERLPHFKMGFTPSSGAELQAEYFIPREKAFEAISAVAELKKEIKPLIQITEIRTIAADQLWMSPAYQRDSVAIHFTLKPNKEGVAKLLPKIEAKLEPFEPRPHWAKLFTLDPTVLKNRYPRLGDFRNLAMKNDPEGKWRNEFIDRYVF